MRICLDTVAVVGNTRRRFAKTHQPSQGFCDSVTWYAYCVYIKFKHKKNSKTYKNEKNIYKRYKNI